MGRNRTPTAEKIAKGNPGKRALNRREPDPQYLDDMTPPAWLPDEAKKVWSEFAPKMRQAKVLTVIDVEPFARWCRLVVRYRAVANDLERLGVMLERAPDGEKVAVVKDAKDGEKKPAPTQVIINQLVFVESMLMKQLLAVEREFGMTPAARTRVQVDPQLTLFPDERAGATGTPHKPKDRSPSRFFTGGGAATH